MIDKEIRKTEADERRSEIKKRVEMKEEERRRSAAEEVSRRANAIEECRRQSGQSSSFFDASSMTQQTKDKRSWSMSDGEERERRRSIAEYRRRSLALSAGFPDNTLSQDNDDDAESDDESVLAFTKGNLERKARENNIFKCEICMLNVFGVCKGLFEVVPPFISLDQFCRQHRFRKSYNDENAIILVCKKKFEPDSDDDGCISD